jgi:hypothetical protein
MRGDAISLSDTTVSSRHREDAVGERVFEDIKVTN